MPKASPQQNNFNSGVLSPYLVARSDLQRYQTALKDALNIIPLPQGGIMKRPGTKWICPVKDSTKLGRLIPFEVGTTQAYMIQAGNLTFRFLKNYDLVTTTPQVISGITGANPGVLTYVGADTFANTDRVWIKSVVGMVEVNNREMTVAGLNAGANTFQLSGVNTSAYTAYASGGTVGKIIEVATPYADTDLADLSYVQSADTLYLFHPSYAPRKLTRSSDTSWALTTITYTDGPFAGINSDDSVRIRIRKTGTSYRPGQSVTLLANSAIFSSTHVGGLFYIEEILFDQIAVMPWTPDTNVLTGFTVNTKQVSNDGHVYLLVDAGNGTNTGSVAPVHTQGDAWDADFNSGNKAKKWRYLHSRYCVLQISAFTSATQVTATVITYAPDGLDQPGKTVTNCVTSGGLIKCTIAAHGYADGDYINISGVGGTTEANGDWQISWVDANTFTLNGSTFVHAFVSSGTAVRYSTWLWAHGAFSDARGYPSCGTFFQDRLVVAGTTSQPDTIWASVTGDYTSYAARTIGGLVTDDRAIAVTVSSQKVNKIRWLSSDGGGLLVGTVGNEFILRPATTTKAFAPSNVEAKPNSTHGSKDVAPVSIGSATLFVQKAGRKLREAIFDASVDRYVANDLTLASNTITAGGLVELAYAQEPDNIVWSARGDGALLGLTYDREQQIVGWHPHELGGYSDAGHTTIPVVESVASIPSPDGTHDDLYLLVKRYINGSTVRYVEYLDRSWDKDAGAIEDCYFLDCGATYDSTATSTVSGLNHLIGETVSIITDGSTHATKVVSAAGTIALDVNASVVQVGYNYNGDAEILPPDAGSATGTAQGKEKRIGRMRLWLHRTGTYKAGRDEGNLDQREFRDNIDPMDTPPALFSGIDKITWDGGSDPLLPVLLRQDKPLPFILLATLPQLETQDK